MEHIIKKINGITLIDNDGTYRIEYDGAVLLEETTDLQDAELSMNGILLGIHMAETYGLEVFKAVEKVVTEQNESE
jgi:ABC-type lipoprotein release transport system permease subunit